jgi:hypothetical protein
VPQIFEIIKMRSTGQLAFATCFLGFAGSAARLSTVLIESDDMMYNVQFIIGFALNAIIIVLFFVFWGNAATEQTATETSGKAKVADTKKGGKVKKGKID